MEREFWLARWQRNEIGFHQDAINLHLERYWPRLGVAEGATIFVPLCGKSRDMLWLRAQGYRVVGVEISPLAVEQFFSDNGLAPERTTQGRFERWECDGVVILCGDLFDLIAGELAGVAAIYDRASLVALPPEMRRRYASHLAAITPAGVPTLLVAMEYPQGEMEGPPFAVGDREVRELFAGRAIDLMAEVDVLAENPAFARRGVGSLLERVYHLG